MLKNLRKLLATLPLIALLATSVFGLTPLIAQTKADANQADVTLTVFAAASLTDAFNDIGKQFETYNPGVKVVFNYAGSQQLTQQLAQGAAADVFASANQTQMDVAGRTVFARLPYQSQRRSNIWHGL
jgi:molybdate transport system substrate-binding protein